MGDTVGGDESDSRPQAVHVGAAELVVGAEGISRLFPDSDQGFEVGVPGDVVRKVSHRGGTGRRRAPSARECLAALDRVEVGVLVKGEGSEVMNGRGDSEVQDVGRLAALLLVFDALVARHARGRIQRRIDHGEKEASKLVVQQV